MTDYLTLTNLIRLLVVGSFAWWLLIDVPRWWRKRQAAKNEWAAKVPQTPKEPKPPRIKLSRKKADDAPDSAGEEEPVIVRRRSLTTIAAQHGTGGVEESRVSISPAAHISQPDSSTGSEAAPQV